MIQTALNTMLTVMLAKFLLNDMPHAAGFIGSSHTKTMYHTTHYDKWESIKVGGIIPEILPVSAQEVTGYSKGVYLEEDREEAFGWAGMLAGWYLPEGDEAVVVKFAVLEVKIPEDSVLTSDPDVYDVGGEQPTAFIYQHQVLPEHIRLVDVTEVEIG